MVRVSSLPRVAFLSGAIGVHLQFVLVWCISVIYRSRLYVVRSYPCWRPVEAAFLPFGEPACSLYIRRVYLPLWPCCAPVPLTVRRSRSFCSQEQGFGVGAATEPRRCLAEAECESRVYQVPDCVIANVMPVVIRGGTTLSNDAFLDVRLGSGSTHGVKFVCDAQYVVLFSEEM